MTRTAIVKALDTPVRSAQGLVNCLGATGYLDEWGRVHTLGIAPCLLNVIAGRPPVTQVLHEALEAINEETGIHTVLSAAVGVIGSRGEIDERRDDLVEILGRHVATWQLD